MSSRKEKKLTGGNKKKGDEEQRENILQAVVLTDSYQTRFRPLTLEYPRCLLPVCNTPLIEYTLEWLSYAGVEEVFIFASTHAEKIEDYIRDSKWNLPSSPFKRCQIVMSPSSMSVGDAMRELDVKGMITTDFLLLNGDVVSNLPLEGILEAHRKRRTQNKDSIMTMILRQSGFEHRSKARGESGVFVIDESSQRCIHYEEMRQNTTGGSINLTTDLFKQHPQLRIRTDLIDCHVDLCSPDVPALFTENFDYQHIRRHFLHGILTDFELYGKMIHTHIVSNGYAARVRSLQTYDAVSRDIMERWTVPLVPDSNLGTDQNYSYFRQNIYKDEGVMLGRDCETKRNVILARGVTVGDNTVITNSVIGVGCKIGSNVVLDKAFIWDGVEIDDNCKIQNSIIANNVMMGKNCIVVDGSVVSYGVKLKNGTNLAGQSRMTNYRRKQELEDSEHAVLSGSEYEPSESESEGEEAAAAQDGLVCVKQDFNKSSSDISLLPGEESDIEDDSDSEDAIGAPQRDRSNSATSAVSAASAASGASEDNDEKEAWHKEASSSIYSAVSEDRPLEVVTLELNGLRMTANASWHQARKAIATALVTHIEKVATKDGMTTAKATTQVLRDWKQLIKRGLHEHSDQVDLLLIVQRECVNRKTGESLLLNFVQKLYDPLDLVDEDAINKWWSDIKSQETSRLRQVRKLTEAFVNWLAEADSEEESEEEESDEE